MHGYKTLLLSILLLALTKVGIANDRIDVSITLSWNSSVTLTKDQKGQYSGKLYLSTKRASDTTLYATLQPIAADTAAKLLQKILELGLLDISSSELKVIDGFRTNILITQPQGERKIALVTGVASDENSSKAGNIINLLSTALNVKTKLFSYLNTLPAGNYNFGMSWVKVHQLLPVDGKKSSLYLSYEEAFKKNRIDIPLYVIDGKIVEPIDLNKYELADIADVKIIKGESAAALYGLQGANGVVLLTTKI